MQQTVLKFIALLYRHCSTCFGHHSAHHQEPNKPPLQPLVSLWMCRWMCSQPWSAENTSTSKFIRKPEAATSVWRAPDDGHCNARNMLSSVCTTKQWILRLIVASSWLFYSNDGESPKKRGLCWLVRIVANIVDDMHGIHNCSIDVRIAVQFAHKIRTLIPHILN
jgi:hypothetical protein